MEMYFILKVTPSQVDIKLKNKSLLLHQLLDQIMFINVFRKSPQKQFTGELTDLQSFLTEVPA